MSLVLQAICGMSVGIICSALMKDEKQSEVMEIMPIIYLSISTH
jgi:hypothetical protein